MLVVWSWRSFFRSFFLTLIIAGMMLLCGMGMQKAFQVTEMVGYGAEKSDYVPFLGEESEVF